MLYYILFITIFILAFLERFTIHERNTYYYLFIVMVFILYILSSLRWERGTDWTSFYLFFQNPWTWWDTHFELGFTLFNRLVRSFTDNYTIYLFVQNAIYYGLTIWIYKQIRNEHSELGSFFFIILLFQFSLDFAGLFSTRSQIASALCTCALFDLIKGNKRGYLIKVLLAASFHLMSVSFLLVYILYCYKGSYKKFFSTILFSSAIVIVIPSLLIFIIKAIPRLSRYAVYINKESRNLSIPGIAQWILLLAVFIYTRKFTTNKHYNLFLMIFTFGVAMYIWSALYSFYFNRIAGIFLGVGVIMLPSVFSAFKGRQAVIVFCIFSLYCFFTFNASLNGQYSVLYLPYKTVFNDFEVVSDIL